MSTSKRSFAAKLRRAEYNKKRWKNREHHPVFHHGELAALSGLRHEHQESEFPDRSLWLKDPDREARIRAHAERVAREMGR